MKARHLKAIQKAVKYAETKHPVFPNDPVKACAVLAEEAGEAIREANHIDEGRNRHDEMMHEVLQSIAVGIRILDNFDC